SGQGVGRVGRPAAERRRRRPRGPTYGRAAKASAAWGRPAARVRRSGIGLRRFAVGRGYAPDASRTRPRSELVSAAVITTSTNWPTRRGGAGKFTERVFSVLPVSSFGSLREGPVTSTFCTLPTIAREMPAEYSLICACR